MHVSFVSRDMTLPAVRRRAVLFGLWCLALLLTTLGSSLRPAGAKPAEPLVALPASVSNARALQNARPLSAVEPTQTISMAFTLPLRNQGQLANLLHRLYDPQDPLYHKFLSANQFRAQFSPTEASYQTVINYARSQGLTVTGTHAGRTLLDVSGPASKVQSALGVELRHFQIADGTLVYANTAPARVPQSLTAHLSGIVGLNSLSLYRRPQFRIAPGGQADANVRAAMAGSSSPASQGQPLVPLVKNPTPFGTGPVGGLDPLDIYHAYGLNNALTSQAFGAGQSLALYELEGYNPADVTAYITQFKLPTLPVATLLTNVLVDGFTGVPDPKDVGGQIECTLDIDMMLAIAIKASHIYVYEGQNGTVAGVDLYQRIADDNLAQAVSTSWGLPEDFTDATTREAENSAFQQMAAQGQSMFAAAGDSGAYTDGFALSVGDPASQPFVTGVGGTKLLFAKTGGPRIGETTWVGPGVLDPNGPEGGGGGSSAVWVKPDYQAGLGSSPTTRDVPDVSLNADPNTGYDITVASASKTFFTVGGTSAAAPLWAAFTALVNQQRAANGLVQTDPTTGATTGYLGFANPPLYALARSAAYNTVFNDIADNSNNLFYTAVPGYDDATGLGTFVGDPLMAALSFNPDQGGAPGTLSGTVINANGTPVVGATVTVVSEASRNVKGKAVTTATGAFSFTLPSGIIYDVSADAAGEAGQSVSGVTVPAGGTTTLLPFVLTPGHVFSPGLQMISAPYEYTGVADFPTLFGLTLPLKSIDPRLIAWQPTLNAYVVYPVAPADTFHRGQGYWVSFPAIEYVHRQGAVTSFDQPFRVTLQPGWNQVGDPFPFASPLSTLTTDSVTGGASTSLAGSALVSPTLYRYDTSSGAYVALDVTADSLQPWQGYWIYAKQPAVLTVPATGGPPTGPTGLPTL